jgi:hypothetical protein
MTMPNQQQTPAPWPESQPTGAVPATGASAPQTQPQSTPAPSAPAPQERTFTQEDVDRIVGERLARDRAARATEPPAPAPQQHPDQTPASAAPQPTPGGDTPVFSELIAQAVSQAVQQAVAPLQQRFAQDDQARAQQAFATVLNERAGQILADPRDAALLDHTALVDANGQPDAARIDAALQQLVTDRPHLRRGPRVGVPSAQGAGFGSPAPASPQDAANDLRARYGA